MVISTLAVDGWVVTFGTAERSLGGCALFASFSLFAM